VQVNVDNSNIIVAVSGQLNKLISGNVHVGFTFACSDSGIVANSNHWDVLSEGQVKLSMGKGIIVLVYLDVSGGQRSRCFSTISNTSWENCMLAGSGG
jgi:hypothetical protein